MKCQTNYFTHINLDRMIGVHKDMVLALNVYKSQVITDPKNYISSIVYTKYTFFSLKLSRHKIKYHVVTIPSFFKSALNNKKAKKTLNFVKKNNRARPRSTSGKT